MEPFELGFVGGSGPVVGGRRSGGVRTCRNVVAPEQPASVDRKNLEWTPGSWREMPVRQVPDYPDKEKLEDVEEQIRRVLPLVFSGEVERLKSQLAKAAAGKHFVLQGGDCAESFEEFEKYGGDNIRDTFTLLIQMSIAMMYGLKKPVVKIGRMAGQFAKPRSSPMEKAKNQELELPSYRGDMINGPEFTLEARVPDPDRMIRALNQSTATINLLRALASGGYLDLHKVHDINLQFVNGTPQGQQFLDYANNITNAIAFMGSCGLPTDSPDVRQAEFYVSHEALLLPYEEAMTRYDKNTGKHYATSGHFIWLGDRTRQPNGAHVEFLRGIANPIGIKWYAVFRTSGLRVVCVEKLALGIGAEPEFASLDYSGPTLSRDDLLELLEILDPNNEPGRITLINRVGAGKVWDHLPRHIETIKEEGRNVLWVCDAMHGNTESSPSGYKTRRFENVLSEVKEFFEVHKAMGTYPGGIHLEMTGQNVTECVGGMMELDHEDLFQRYESQCDPRLNASQALELAFLVSEMMTKQERQ